MSRQTTIKMEDHPRPYILLVFNCQILSHYYQPF